MSRQHKHVADEPGAERRLVEESIRGRARPGRPIRILEAGCGRKWVFRMPDVEYELTGVDLDAAALAARKDIVGDLHRGIVGDLRTVELEEGAYDVIYSSFVLEHVPGAEQVLENFLRWLAPGGIIVVRVPDRDSIQGFTVRLTPFWLHVLYYRYVVGLREAGRPGFGPYPTVYDRVITRRGMREFAARHGLVLRREVSHGEFRRGGRLMRALISAYARVVAVASLGRVHDRAANLTFILEKPDAGEAPRRLEPSRRAAPAASCASSARPV